jgi:ribosomal protein S18 acetylase RimI-like enzyme
VTPPGAGELERIERHLFGLPGDDGAEVREDPALGALRVRRTGAGPEADYLAMPRWSPDGWRKALEHAAAAMRAAGAWPSLLVADMLDRPVGLADRLEASGWRRVHAETVMWVARASVVPHLDPGLRIEAVRPGRVADHEALERHIFGFPEPWAAERRESLARALRSGRLRAYLVRLGDEPVAVARLSQGDGVAGLSGVGVLEPYRGRGIGTLITTVATRAGLATGNRIVWLSVADGNAEARRLYEALGFQPAFGWARWTATVRPPAGERTAP